MLATKSRPTRGDGSPVVICFSHLRWNFVYQRPQHLMSRMAAAFDVLYVEEPVFTDDPTSRLSVQTDPHGVQILVPHISKHSTARLDDEQRRLLDDFLAHRAVSEMVLWYYTPMSLSYSRHLRPRFIVYDCMDELSAFKGAPPELLERERELNRARRRRFHRGP